MDFNFCHLYWSLQFLVFRKLARKWWEKIERGKNDGKAAKILREKQKNSEKSTKTGGKSSKTYRESQKLSKKVAKKRCEKLRKKQARNIKKTVKKQVIFTKPLKKKRKIVKKKKSKNVEINRKKQWKNIKKNGKKSTGWEGQKLHDRNKEKLRNSGKRMVKIWRIKN